MKMEILLEPTSNKLLVDTIISDSKDSTVTYTEVSSPFEDLSNIGSPIVDGLPLLPQDPYAYVEAALQAPAFPDYVPSPEHLPTPEFVTEPVYPKFMPPEDDALLAEEQPLLVAISPIGDLPGYILSPIMRREEESFRDEADDEEEDKDKEEKEEHLAPTDFVPPPVHRVTARISVRAQTPISLPSAIEVTTLLAIPTPPQSLLSPLLRAKAPSTSHPPPLIVFPHTRASMATLIAVAPLTYILAPRSETPPSGTPSHLYLHHHQLCFYLLRAIERMFLRHTGDFRVDYGFVGTLDDQIRRDPKREDDRLLMSDQLNMLRKDRRAHARTTILMESVARLSQESLKMAPKRTIRSIPATPTTTTTTHVPNSSLKVLIDQGIADVLAARSADGCKNGEDSHDSGMGIRRQAPLAFGPDVAYAMTQIDLKKKMIDKYCLSDEIKKLKVKLCNLKVKGTDVDVIEFTTELMDKKISTFAERQAKNKRKFKDTSKNNQNLQQNKKQNTGRAYTTRSSEKKPYG
nr:hypothetical protein [Tanacetum cinerariifolium]